MEKAINYLKKRFEEEGYYSGSPTWASSSDIKELKICHAIGHLKVNYNVNKKEALEIIFKILQNEF